MSVTITAKQKLDRPRAVLIVYEDEDIWLPKSQIVSSAIVGDDMYKYILTDWIARQKNITEGIAEERFVVEANGAAWYVKDMGVNPIRKMCICDNERDAMIIGAALEMTKNKTL